MPFDTIAIAGLPYGMQPSKIKVWGYHFESEPFRFVLPALPTLPEIPLNAIPTTTFTALVVFSLSLTLMTTKPYPLFSTSMSSVKSVAGATSQRIQAPIKVNIHGVELPNFDTISAMAKPMAQRSLPVVAKHGGFESVYQQAGKKYGVPWQLISAVHYVETGQSGDSGVSSGAGATGPMQFMPGTFSAYAQDGDGDGRATITDVHDSIFTAAKYLAANGAGRGNVRGALFRYNHSNAYVEKVLGYAAAMGYR